VHREVAGDARGLVVDRLDMRGLEGDLMELRGVEEGWLARDGRSVRLLMLSEDALKERRGSAAEWRRDRTLEVPAGAWRD
jgi:hypothetical protein